MLKSTLFCIFLTSNVYLKLKTPPTNFQYKTAAATETVEVEVDSPEIFPRNRKFFVPFFMGIIRQRFRESNSGFFRSQFLFSEKIIACNMILPLQSIYFSNRTLTFMFASQMAQLGFFQTSMSQPGIELTSDQSFVGPYSRTLYRLIYSAAAALTT